MARRLFVFGALWAALCLSAAQAGLVAYWAFEEGTGGNTADVAGGHDASLRNGAAWSGQPAPTAYPNTNSISFDGNNDFVRADGYKGVTGTQARTISAWIKTTGKNNEAIISWGQNQAGKKWNFRVQDSNGTAGAIRVEVNNGYIVGDTDVRDDAWHHVAAVLPSLSNPNARDVLLYVDGVPQGTSAERGQAINTASNADVRIGRDFSPRYFKGLIDEVAIWDHALGPFEIGQLAAGTAPPDIVPSMTLDVMGRSSGGSTWHFSSDRYLPDDPSGLVDPVTLAGGTQTANVTLPPDIPDEPFFVVVEATDTGSPPSLAGALRAPRGYVFDANNNDVQDPGENQFFSTTESHWTAGGSLAGWWYITQDANEVGPAGYPFPGDAEAIWYGMGGGTVCFAAMVPQLIPGQWGPPPSMEIQGTPLTSVSTDPGLSAFLAHPRGTIPDLDRGLDYLDHLRPGDSGHHTTAVLDIPRADIGPNGLYPSDVGIPAPDHADKEGDPADYVARITGYLHIPEAWDQNPDPDVFEYTRTFAVGSDDGFRLKIGDTLVAQATGNRSFPTPPDIVPVRFTAPGYWPIEVEWYHANGANPGLEVASREGAWMPDDWQANEFTVLGDPADDLQVFQNPDALNVSHSGPGLLGFYYDVNPESIGAQRNITSLEGLRSLVENRTPNYVRPLDVNLDLPPGAGANRTNGNVFGSIGVSVGNNNDLAWWRGQLNITTEGDYRFRARSDDGAALLIDGQLVANNTGYHGIRTDTGTIHLTPGAHDIDIAYYERDGDAGLIIDWDPPGGGSAWQVFPVATACSYEVTGALGANSVGEPLWEGTLPSPPDDGLRVQQAFRGATTNNVDQAINFFRNNPDAGVIEVRQLLDMRDPQNGSDGNWPGYDPFPIDTPANDNNFVTRITGLVYIPSPGIYPFSVSTGDGFDFYINGKRFARHAGDRGLTTGTSNYIYAYFPKAGLYPIEFYHYEHSSGSVIEFAHGVNDTSPKTILVQTTNPANNGFEIDWGGVGFNVEPQAELHLNYSTLAIAGTAVANVPALGMNIRPDRWVLEERLEGRYPGLLGAYYTHTGNWNPAVLLGYRHDLTPDSRIGGPSPAPDEFYFDDNFGYGPWGTQEDRMWVQWTGFLTVDQDGTYYFREMVDNRARLWIDDIEVLNDNSYNTHTIGNIDLAAGEHTFRFIAMEDDGGERTALQWLPPWDTTHDLGNPGAWDYVPAQYFSTDLTGLWSILADNLTVADLLLAQDIMTFPFGSTHYLRLTTEVAGLVAVAEGLYTFVPEPTTSVLVGLGLLMLARRRRRK